MKRRGCSPAGAGRLGVAAGAHLGQREGVAQVEHAVHVGVGEVAEELVLRAIGACAGRVIRAPAGRGAAPSAVGRSRAPSAGASASNTLSSCHFCCTDRCMSSSRSRRAKLPGAWERGWMPMGSGADAAAGARGGQRTAAPLEPAAPLLLGVGELRLVPAPGRRGRQTGDCGLAAPALRSRPGPQRRTGRPCVPARHDRPPRGRRDHMPSASRWRLLGDPTKRRCTSGSTGTSRACCSAGAIETRRDRRPNRPGI
jgi:hypothetical protein